MCPVPVPVPDSYFSTRPLQKDWEPGTNLVPSFSSPVAPLDKDNEDSGNEVDWERREVLYIDDVLSFWNQQICSAHDIYLDFAMVLYTAGLKIIGKLTIFAIKTVNTFFSEAMYDWSANSCNQQSVRN